MRRTVAVLTLLLCVLPVLAGCGEDNPSSPSSGDDTPTTINIEFSGGSVTPKGRRVEVKAGEPVELVVKADKPGELHVHSTPEKELPYGAGTTRLTLAIHQPGVVDVESHDLGVVVVQLEVS
jgi:hypothetical protein